jgi:hypothetical protein
MIRRSRTPMTVLQLKRTMDRRFDRTDRSNRRRFTAVDAEIAELREEIRRSAAETRRHMDMIAESIREDLRLFADAIGLHSERLNRHDTRIDRLEQRSFQS